MHRQETYFRSAMTELVVWCVATPVLAVFALVSLLPIASLIGAWGDPLSSLIALAFLGTSAVALLAAAAGYRLLLWNHVARSVSPAARTMRVICLSVYGLIWMTAYGVYSMN